MEHVDLHSLRPQLADIGGGFQHHLFCFPGQSVDQMDADADAPDFQGLICLHKFLQIVAAIDNAGRAFVDRLQAKLHGEQRALF